jgi:hypothetical protein
MMRLCPALVEKAAFQRLGVFRTQLEDMPDLDAAAEFQLAFAVRRRIAGDDVAQIGDQRRLRQIAAKIHSGQVKAGFVGTANEVAHHCHAAVGINRNARQPPTGPMIAGLAAECSGDLVVAREAEFAQDASVPSASFRLWSPRSRIMAKPAFGAAASRLSTMAIALTVRAQRQPREARRRLRSGCDPASRPSA